MSAITPNTKQSERPRGVMQGKGEVIRPCRYKKLLQGIDEVCDQITTGYDERQKVCVHW